MKTQLTPFDARRSAAHGQMMVLFALTLTVFIGALMLGVDLSRLRTLAENAQRAANAAALAGVVFVPDYPSTAYYRASEEARKNGFVSGRNGVTVSTTTLSGYPNRLKVTIAEPVSLIFGRAFGLVPQTISRSATGEYYMPLQMGSPDNVLGYAPFPTTMVTGTVPEGFYLENKGQYTLKESGDAYSPLFESFTGATYGPSGDLPKPTSNPCSPVTICGTAPALQTTPNGDHYNTGDPLSPTSFTGYKYIVDDPLTNTLVIKLFDPYDEASYDAAAKSWDSAHSTAFAPSDSNNATTPITDSTTVGSTCVLGGATPCPTNKLIDQASPSGNGPLGSHEVTQEFSLSGPGLSPYDPNMRQVTATAPATDTVCATVNCVYQQGSGGTFDAGNDPTTCTAITCTASSYAYQFMNYAIIHGPGVFRLNVQSVVNADNSLGTRGNAYGVAVCADPGPGATLGATSDPFTNSPTNPGDAMGWNAASCLNPNSPANGGQCSNPNNPSPGAQCIHVYGLGKMAIHNWLSGSASSGNNALVPLGYIPPTYAGKTLQIRLFDVGDISGGSNYIEALTPAGDLSHYSGALTSDGYPSTLDYSYSATPDNNATGYKTINPAAPATASTPITITNGSGAIYNGSWLTMQVPVTLPGTKTYAGMVASYGGYWKMLYHIGGNADDATTWAISVGGSPVHLIN